MAAFLRSVRRLGVSAARVVCGNAGGGGMRVSPAVDGVWFAVADTMTRKGGRRLMSGHSSVPGGIPRMTQLAWIKSSHHSPSGKDEDGESERVVTCRVFRRVSVPVGAHTRIGVFEFRTNQTPHPQRQSCHPCPSSAMYARVPFSKHTTVILNVLVMLSEHCFAAARMESSLNCECAHVGKIHSHSDDLFAQIWCVRLRRWAFASHLT